MKRNSPLDSEPITIVRIERALDCLAKVMVSAGKGGVRYLPIYERLEWELEELKTTKRKMNEIRVRAQRSRL